MTLKQKLWRILPPVLLLILMAAGLWTRWIDQPLLEPLRTGNIEYLEENRTSAVTNFLVLSAIKSGLDVVEGSTIGVSLGATLQLEAGDVVQSAYDIVNIAWYTVLSGMVALILLQWVQETSTFIQTPLALLTLFTWLATVFAGHRLRAFFQLVLTLWLSFAVLMPVALRGSRLLSERLTQQTRREAAEGFQKSRQDLFPEAEATEEKGLRARVESFQTRIRDLGDKLVERLGDLVSWTTRLVAVYLLDTVIFPLLCFLLPLALIRRLLTHQRERSRDRHLGQEIARNVGNGTSS